ncbi:MAG: N-acetylmuramoyl-L-alanine amidase [Lachnospiraceae bacterium]|nr:N-acetylmuramoyl-L-alanine amidase [Lachnospiraceae bacterium]
MGKSFRWIMIFAVLSFVFLFPAEEVYATGFSYPLDTDGELVIVIDPGHGGNNLGADYNGFLEKEMNMVVANAMKEELEKYEDVTVYMTHTSTDTDMSIQARADFAASVNADFVFCLHFNMSPGNILFGSEVWVSAFGDENRQGYRFGCVQMETMADMGLYIRGVKTRFNDRGRDYYGILRYCEEYDIPAALIEHCHIDHETDVGFCDSEEDLVRFGVADATSVAKFFGLSSQTLGVDYSDYELIELEPGALYVQADTTDPDICTIEEAYTDLERSIIGITLTAYDYDSPMLYYSYSIDGGITYTPYLAWPNVDVMARYSPDTFTFEIEVPEGVSPVVLVKAVNQYDRYTESNLLDGLPVFVKPVAELLPTEELSDTVSDGDDSAIQASPSAGFHAPEKPEEENKERNFFGFLMVCFFIACILFMALFISNIIIAGRKRQRRKRHKK